MKSLLLSIVLGLMLVQPALSKTPGEVEVGAVLRDVPMRGIAGPSRMLSDYRGTPLIINVWASWCGPCLNEMTAMEKLQRAAPDQLAV